MLKETTHWRYIITSQNQNLSTYTNVDCQDTDIIIHDPATLELYTFSTYVVLRFCNSIFGTKATTNSLITQMWATWTYGYIFLSPQHQINQTVCPN